MTEVIRVYSTEAYARAANDSYDIASATVNSDGGTIHNTSSTIPYYTYNKYYYRIDSNEPVSEFHIDWDDGENNSPEKRNTQVIKLDSPSFFAVTEHVYTEAKDFWPLIRVKSSDGYLSKWYTNNSSNNSFTELENETLSAGNTGTSVVQIETDAKDKIPHFIPSHNPPVGVLKTDRKRIFAGIDNKKIDNYTTTQAPLLYAYTKSSNSLGTAALVKLTVAGRMRRATREYTLHGDDIAVNDASIDNSELSGSPAGSESEMATRAIPYGNYRAGSNAYEQTTFKFKTGDGTGGGGDKADLNTDYIIIYTGNQPYLIYFDTSGGETTPPTVDVPGGGTFADTLRVRLDETGGEVTTQTNVGFATKLYNTGRVSSLLHTFDTAFTWSMADPAEPLVTLTATTYENQPDPTVSDTTYIKDAGDVTTYVDVQGTSIAFETDYAGELLRAELLNVNKLSDDERIYIKVFDITRGAHNTYIDVDADETVCILSNGNPIVDSNESNSRMTIDASESFTRESNLSISSYYYDLDSLNNATIQAQATVASNLGNISDEFHADLGKPSTTSTRISTSYTNGSEGHLKDSFGRYYDFHRLCRVQVGDDHTIVTGSGDISNRRSAVEHYDDDQYSTTTQYIPSSLESRGYIALSNAQTVDRTCWRNLTTVSRTTGTMIGGAVAESEAEYDLRYTADNPDPIAQTGHPMNWLLICKTDQFDRIYFRMNNTYLDSDTAADIDITAYYSHNGGWKPLKIIDNTNRLKASGSIEFIVPHDWKSVTSDGITFSDPDGTEKTATGRWNGPVDSASDESIGGVVNLVPRTGHDPETMWDFSAYGILIGINVTAEAAKVQVANIWPFSNSHSQLIKVVDPHHVSLNDIAIAQSISFNRDIQFTTITDRFGMSEIRKLGAKGGMVTFGSIDLGDTDVSGNRKKIKQFQQKSTPVFLDVAHTSGEFTRFYGVITSMSEDHPVGKQFPKYGVKMQVSHIIELDSSYNLLSDKISIGGEVDGRSQYVSSA